MEVYSSAINAVELSFVVPHEYALLPTSFSNLIVVMAIDHLGCAHRPSKTPDRKQETISQQKGSTSYFLFIVVLCVCACVFCVVCIHFFAPPSLLGHIF